MIYKQIFEEVSLRLKIPVEVVEYAYKSYWKFIKETIQILPLKDIQDEGEFIQLRTNFNIPSLGKLGITLDKFLKMKRCNKIVKKIKNDKNKKD